MKSTKVSCFYDSVVNDYRESRKSCTRFVKSISNIVLWCGDATAMTNAIATAIVVTTHQRPSATSRRRITRKSSTEIRGRVYLFASERRDTKSTKGYNTHTNVYTTSQLGWLSALLSLSPFVIYKSYAYFLLTFALISEFISTVLHLHDR